MTGTMRGICKTRPAPGAEYRTDIPIPQITEDQVLMKVHATAICGTDLHIYNWGDYAANRMKNLPMVFGHETAGMPMMFSAATSPMAEAVCAS